MIVLVDVDGVVAQFYQSMLLHTSKIASVRFANDAKLKEVIKYTDIFTYWCYNQMPEEHVQIANEVTSQDSFWRNLPEIPYAIEALNKLYDKHTIIFVTSPTERCSTWASARLAWLQEKFPWVTSDSLIITHAKSYIDGDVLIEDSADNLRKWNNQRIVRNNTCHQPQGFLFYAPYNKKENLPQYGWQGILSKL